MNFGVPQGSVLGPLLFLIYINDIHIALKYCKTRLFADDTSLLIKNKSLKQLQKHLNLDLRNLCNWQKANKISLNARKTELLIFRHPNKHINYNFKIKIDGKRLIPSKFVKYLGILIDSHLNWEYQTDLLASKLSRAIGILSKIRHYVCKDTLRNIYFGIFSSILTYWCNIWGQVQNKHIKRLIQFQNKAIRVINFASYHSPVDPLYKNSKILKICDVIKLQNFVYIHDSINGNLPSSLINIVEPTKQLHRYNTRGASHHQISIPKANTLVYGIRSIKYQFIQFWNFIVNM